MRNRSRQFNVPARIILNEEGEAFFLRHQKSMNRFEDSEGNARFGFKLETIDLQWLKKMLLKGLVAKIEVKVLNIAKTNSTLRDAIRLIFFSMFRHRISLSVLQHIYSSPMVQTWNRHNPKRSIGPGAKISKETLRETLEQRREEIASIQSELEDMISKKTYYVRDKWDDERSLRNFTGEIIHDLDPLIIFILSASRWEDRADLLRTISSQIAAFADMVDALDMASLLSVELVSASERSALYQDAKEQHDFDIAEELIRVRQLKRKNEFKGTTLVISIPHYIPGNRERLKFRFSFYNNAADADTERKLMESFVERSARFHAGRNLDEFFHENSGPVEDNPMRFYYLTVLQELCGKHNMAMDSRINSFDGSTVTTLSFGF